MAASDSPGFRADNAPANAHLLRSVAAIAEGFELSQTLSRIVGAAVELVDAEFGALGVIDPAGEISDFIFEGLSVDQVADMGPPPRGDGILGLLISQPSPLRLHDLLSHPASVGFPANHPPMHSFVGVPVRVRDVVFGNLYLTQKRGGGDFTDADELVLVSLAAAAGVAIENARLYTQVDQRARWLRASSQVSTGALQGGSPEDVLQTIAVEARRAGEAELSVICTVQPDGGYVVAHTDGGPPAGEWLDKTIASPEDVGDQTHVTLVVPIRTPDRDLGSLVLVREVASPFSDDERVLAQAYGAQAGLAVVLAAARGQHERLALLEDRDRIGRDLHDLVIQRLFATGMMLQGAQRLAANPEVDDRIGRAVEELDQTIREVRSTIFALHQNRDGEAIGLRAKVLREVASGSGALGFEPTVRFDGPIDSTIPADIADHVVAALREALSNAARHAQASQVRVSLSVDSGEVVLIVTDNGRGLAPGSDRRSGLANLESRAGTLGGRFSVEPVILTDEAEVAGTRLTWRAPLTE